MTQACPFAGWDTFGKTCARFSAKEWLNENNLRRLLLVQGVTHSWSAGHSVSLALPQATCRGAS